MKRNYGKLLLDTAMLIILLLSYSHNSVNQAFHEIAGFALMAGVLVHLLWNRKWIAGVTRRFFREKLPAVTRAGYIVDFLMLVCFAAVGISGAMISKVVFSLGGGMIWRTVHYFASAALLVLLGIHLGLHVPFFAATLGRHIRLPQRVRRGLAIVLTVLICAWGCRCLVTTSFMQWLAMPFSASQGLTEGGRGGDFDGSFPAQGTLPDDTQAAPGSNDSDSGTALPADGQTTAQAASGSTPDAALPADGQDGAQAGPGRGQQDGSGFGKGGRGEGFGSGDGEGFGSGDGEGFGSHQGEGGGFSAARALSTLADFFSITFVFAALTQLVLRLAQRRKASRPAA